MAVSCEQICSKCGFVRKIYSQKKKKTKNKFSEVHISIFAPVVFTLTTTRTILVSSLMTKINFPLSCIVLFLKKNEKKYKKLFSLSKNYNYRANEIEKNSKMHLFAFKNSVVSSSSTNIESKENLNKNVE